MKLAGLDFSENRTIRPFVLACCCFFALLLFSACPFFAVKADASDGNPRLEMVRLLEEAPSLSSYPGMNAVILSRHQKNRLLADGSMEKNTRWVLLYNGAMPEGWKSWTVPAPEGGSSGIVRAELYSVPDVKLARTLGIKESLDEREKGASVNIPEAREDSLLYIETVQRFPRRFDVDDQVWVALDMPQWELQVEVEVPRGAKMNWAGSGIGQPDKKQEMGTDRYVWAEKNLPARQGLSILGSGRSSLGFSLKNGLQASLENLKELETRPFPVPRKLMPLLSGKDHEKAGFRLLEALNDAQSNDGFLPPNWLRPATAPVLGEGPWTDWEATFIALGGLRSLGWTATVWWLPSIPVNENVPAGNSLWAFPVIEATPPGGKTFLFKRGTGFGPGKTPSDLIGATLYRPGEGEALAMTVPEGSGSTNRFSARWDLVLDQGGFAAGNLVIQLRGGWDYLLRTGTTVSPEKAEALAREMLAPTPFLSGMGRPELTESGSGLRILVPVRGLLGIAAQRDLLVRFPATALPGVRELLESKGNSKLRFPFSIQQEFLIKVPSGFHLFEPPVVRTKDSGKVTVVETFRNRENKGLVEASQVVGIAASRLDENGFIAMNESLVQAVRWGANSIPLRKR